MAQKLVITLSEEATAEYLSQAAEQTEAEVEASVEPSGPLLHIEIASEGLGASSVWLGSVEIGEADVSFQ